MYSQGLMEHYHNSKYRGGLEKPTIEINSVSQSCGDKVIFMLLVKDDVIVAMRYDGEGSVLTMIVASLLCEWSTNALLTDVFKITMERVEAFMSVELGPTRKRTIRFIIETLHQGVHDYVASRGTVSTAT